MQGDTVTADGRAATGRAAGRAVARGRYLGLVAASVLSLLLVCAVAVAVGPAEVGLADVLASVGGHLGLPGMTDVPPLTDSIVWQLRLPRVLTAWSHGDHPGARALAARFGFTADRTLLQLRMPLPAGTGGVSAAGDPGDTPGAATDIGPFLPGTDDAEWVALNALVFTGHPEQGALTLADLEARQSEPWFDAGDFLLARDRASGRILGYNWLKIEPDDTVGEIYVIGVHPDAAGQGLGRRLMLAGLERLRSRGAAAASLYVEADSTGAVHLYRSLGFADHTVDVQYRRDTR